MPKSKINVLTGLKTAKVSLVKRGANRRPRFPITKSETRIMDEAILKAILECESENESKIASIFKGVSDKGAEAITGALRLLSAYSEELPENVLKGIAELSGLELPVVKAEPTDEDIKKKAAEILAARKAKKAKDDDDKPKFPFMKSLEDAPEELRAIMEPILKSQHEDHQAQIVKANEGTAKAQSEVAKIAKTLGDERDERETKEWITKAATDLSHYPGKGTKEIGEMLKALHDHDPKMADAQFESMKAASESIKKSDLLRTAGVGGAGNVSGSASEKIEKMAEKMIMKSDKPLSKAEAEVEVLKQHPEFYDEYLAENPRQTGMPQQ